MSDEAVLRRVFPRSIRGSQTDIMSWALTLIGPVPVSFAVTGGGGPWTIWLSHAASDRLIAQDPEVMYRMSEIDED